MEQEINFDKKVYDKVLQSNLIDVFNKHHRKDISPHYIERADRNIFAANQIEKTQIERILNLGGGGKRHLQASFSDNNIEVYEVDIQGDCDLKINIDSLEKLPFEDNSFDAVCAFDVLEHLENFHLINEEMFRVSKEYVLVSLPNSATEIFSTVFRNKAQKNPDLDRGVFSYFYGLPLAPPSDRHRWWIYFQDIIRYYYYFSLKNNASIEFWTPKLNLKKKLFKTIFGSHLYHTFFCQHVWIKISK